MRTHDVRTFVKFHDINGKPADLDFGWCVTAFQPEAGYEEYISIDTRRSSQEERQIILDAMNEKYVAIYDDWAGYIRVMIERKKHHVANITKDRIEIGHER